jgi:hypothetical protein
MKINIQPLQPESFYHIYNCGINGENLFKEERNYPYFLQKYATYIEPIASTYVYCLLGNHFHLLIKTRSEIDILNYVMSKNSHAEKIIDKPIYWHISNGFASLFKSYTQSINKAYSRTGRLFEEPFRRIFVHSSTYFTKLIYYIHANPQKHGFIKNFRDYPHNSYHTQISTSATKLQREEVLQWFEIKTASIDFHKERQPLQIFEFDTY